MENYSSILSLMSSGATEVEEEGNLIINVWDNNNYRPCFALQYKNPVEYRTQLGFK